MIPYSFHPDAEAEFSAAAEFYESRVAGLGRLFSAEVQRTIWFVREYPDVGQLFACRFGEPSSIAFRMQSSIVSIESPFTFLPLRICIGDRVTGVIEKWRPKRSLTGE